jgi:chaperonin cofactor prefoldin
VVVVVQVQSEVLARECEQLHSQRESVERQKVQLQQDLKGVEDAAKELEEDIRQHGKKSSIKHGRIDIAHARKKKRLDEELESAIETIEAKRIDIQNVDHRLSELLDARQDKEDEIKGLERKLVEVSGQTMQPVPLQARPKVERRDWSQRFKGRMLPLPHPSILYASPTPGTYVTSVFASTVATETRDNPRECGMAGACGAAEEAASDSDGGGSCDKASGEDHEGSKHPNSRDNQVLSADYHGQERRSPIRRLSLVFLCLMSMTNRGVSVIACRVAPGAFAACVHYPQGCFIC